MVRTIFILRFKVVLWLSLSVLALGLGAASAQNNMDIYTDSLQNGWQNWSWDATVNLGSSGVVHSGAKAISVTITAAWGALYLHHSAFDSGLYTNVIFWLNGGPQGGQKLLVQAAVNGVAQTPGYPLPALAANTWRQFSIPLSALSVANQPNMDGLWLQDQSGAAAPAFYLDDMALLAATNPPTPPGQAIITIDAQLNRHPISPLIYGVAFATAGELAELNSPLNRSGGNAETRYNWQLNAHNRGADWYFESIADASSTPGAAADDHVAASLNGGAEPMLTVPMIGWVPKLGAGRGKLASYSVSKYGPQTDTDSMWMPDAGNGIGYNPGTQATWLITTNNPSDANFPTNSDFQAAWIRHLTNRWGLSTHGGVRYYCMDNEHSIWFSTHRDVHPAGPAMDEIRDRFFDYAGNVKGIDPGALVAAPEEWGWSGYLYSGYDQQHGSPYADRAAHGNLDYVPWLLDQFRQRATNTQQRLLDYLTVHIYPQGGEFGNDISSSMQLLRNRSTRSLWDTNYVDASWINTVVKLIPRLKGWVQAYYPGTRIGITEYNWGAEAAMNGATAQADILGIFGREGVDLATRWTTPDSGSPTYKAMQMYRNYDGNRGTFGDTSVNATGPNPDNVAAFAAVRSPDGALTAMVINKQLSSAVTGVLRLTNFIAGGTAQVWQLTASNGIVRLSDAPVLAGTVSNALPAQSITLFVIPAGAPPPPRLVSGAGNPGAGFRLSVEGVPGQRYILQSSFDFQAWMPVATNTLFSNSWDLQLPATNVPAQFFRAQWAP